MKPKEKRALFELEQLLTFRLSSIYSLISAGTSQELGQYGLVLREWRVMAMLAGQQPISASELVARSPLDKASASRAVASLVERGLVSATPSPVDARMKILELTDAGWELYGKVAPWSLRRQKALMGVLTSTERNLLISMLNRIEKEAARHVRGGRSPGGPGSAGDDE